LIQSTLTDRLLQAGLSREACNCKAALFAKAADALPESDSHRRAAFFVPGRIEVLGKHTDYAGGRSLVVAAEQGFCIVLQPRDDRHVAVLDAVHGDRADFELDPDLSPRLGHWSNYPMTVARRIARNFPDARRGADIALASDLPPAAGMSSSSAMIVGMFLALAEANRLAEHPDYRHNIAGAADLAGYLGTVENGQTFGTLEGDAGVGTFGGSEDHTAILCSKAGRLSEYAYCPVRLEREVAMPGGYTFAVGVSGVVAEKTGEAREKYNAASQLASAVVELWRRRTGRDDPHLAAVVASAPDAVEQLRDIVAAERLEGFDPADLRDRLEHFLTEDQQVLPGACDALARGDLDGFGRFVDTSQHASEHLLKNLVPQTVFLAAAARRHGAAAASAFGAGFGGSVWAMVELDRADSFLASWSDSYRAEFPRDAQSAAFFLTNPGPAAFRVFRR